MTTFYSFGFDPGQGFSLNSKFSLELGSKTSSLSDSRVWQLNDHGI